MYTYFRSFFPYPYSFIIPSSSLELIYLSNSTLSTIINFNILSPLIFLLTSQRSPLENLNNISIPLILNDNKIYVYFYYNPYIIIKFASFVAVSTIIMLLPLPSRHLLLTSCNPPPNYFFYHNNRRFLVKFHSHKFRTS
jgi:hypothetical protein